MATSVDYPEFPNERKNAQIIESIGVLPVRNLVNYPHMAAPLVANRSGSVKALDEALRGDKKILILAQRDANIDRPSLTDLYAVGTLSTVHKAMKLPEDSLHVLVQGVARARVLKVLETEPFMRVQAMLLPEDNT